MTRDYASPDLTYTTANPIIWSCVEASIAITSACLPSLRPVLTSIGATYSKLVSKQTDYFSFGSRGIGLFRRQAKTTSYVPRFRKVSSETSDNAALQHGVNIHPITEGHTFLNVSTEQNTSRAGSDDMWTSHPAVPHNWEYPIATRTGKEPNEV